MDGSDMSIHSGACAHFAYTICGLVATQRNDEIREIHMFGRKYTLFVIVTTPYLEPSRNASCTRVCFLSHNHVMSRTSFTYRRAY